MLSPRDENFLTLLFLNNHSIYIANSILRLQEVSKKRSTKKRADGKHLDPSLLSLPFLYVNQVTSKMAYLGMHIYVMGLLKRHSQWDSIHYNKKKKTFR